MRIDNHQGLRKLAVLAVVSVSSLFLAASAAASPQPFVAGGGKQLNFGTGPGSFAFGLSAHGIGADATGTVTSAAPSPDYLFPFQARVTCLMVFGNDAIITGRVTTPRDMTGTVIVYEAVDNGESNRGMQQPDLLRGSGEPFIFPVDDTGKCFAPVLPPVPILHGNIVVSSGD